MRVIERHYGMDWLRIAAFALLILYHIGMYFVPWSWHVKVADPSDWAQLPMLATNGWRLMLLFLVSGYASAALFAKVGAVRSFLTSRFARLVVPVIFAAAILIPPQPWIELVTQHGYDAGYMSFWLGDYFRFGTLNGIVLPTWQHLWFVVYLWHYTLIAGIICLLPADLRSKARHFASRVLSGGAILLVPIALLVLHAFVLFPDLEITHALVDDHGAHLLYLPAFAFGWLLAGNDVLWSAIRRWWRHAAMLAIIGTAAILLLVGLVVAGATVWDERFDAVLEMTRIVQGWTVIVALIGAADRYCDRDHRWRKPLNEAVYPAYILHQTVIVVVGHWLLQQAIAGWTGFGILLATTAMGCWVFYLAGREVPVLRVLIGLKGWRTKRHDNRPALGHDLSRDLT